MQQIATNPNHYPIEPLLKNEEENYRYSKFLKFWKIIFKVTKNAIHFLHILHTKQDSKIIEILKDK